jgi:hypothetical protein
MTSAFRNEQHPPAHVTAENKVNPSPFISVAGGPEPSVSYKV